MLGSTFWITQRALSESVTDWSEVTAADLSGREGVREVEGFNGLQSDETQIVPGGRGGGDPFSGYYDQDGDEHLDAYGLSLRGRWDLGRVALTSLTGYEWYDRLVEDEGDATPEIRLAGDYTDSAWQVSQELRLEGEGELADRAYRWYVGGYLIQEKLQAFNQFPSVFNQRTEQSFDQKYLTYAPYIGGHYDLTEELALDSGVRYNVDRKQFVLESTVVATASTGSGTEIPPKQEEQTWTGVTGDFTLTYSPFWAFLDEIQNDRFHVYAKYGRGMKGGHYNAGLTRNPNPTQPLDNVLEPAEPEFIHSAEVGIKTGWLDDRLNLSVTGFRYWYKDLQVFDIRNARNTFPFPELLNADARVWGAEVELEARPLPGLFVTSAAGWLDSHFEEFTVQKYVSQGQRGEGIPATFDYAGNPLIAAPSYSVSTIVEYELDLFGWGTLVPQYDFSWQSKSWFDPQALDPISQEPYWLHNARLAYRTPDGRIEVAGWVQNLFDERYKIDAFDLSIEFNEILEVWGDPRTYGLTVTYSW
jgi:iron complex outermembrane receptor protein